MKTIVIDVGCQQYPGEDSVGKLLQRFSPALLLGFDPALAGDEVERVGSSLVVRRKAVCWLYSGRLGMNFCMDGNLGGVESRPARTVLDAIDLAGLVRALPQPLILKLDCEGAEYPLLADIHAAELDIKLELVLVEYHPQDKSHGWYVVPDARPKLRCPVELWP